MLYGFSAKTRAGNFPALAAFVCKLTLLSSRRARENGWEGNFPSLSYLWLGSRF